MTRFSLRYSFAPSRENRLNLYDTLAGRARIGKTQVFLGIALWMREPRTLGRLVMEPEQYRDVLRLAFSGD